MRLKKCPKCGKMFRTARYEQALCDECIAAGRATTILPRTCRQCGAVFDGGPRAWYCPDCRKTRNKESKKRYRTNGPSRPLGSIDHCTVCGKEYVVNSARQRYCPDCAPEAVRAVDREASKAWNAENDFYDRTPAERSGQKICVICGKPVPGGTARVTCSDECDRLRRKLLSAEADLRRGKRKSLPDINRLDKMDPDAVIPADVINSLMDDLRDVVIKCPECGEWFVKKTASTKFCKSCAENRKLAYMRDYAKSKVKVKQPARTPEAAEAVKQYQADYYRKNRDRIQAQRKAKKEKDKDNERV